ncbi:hypothetical protein DFA_12304 [Cavenderia fasciculata]|uniref:Uncharacterized protein n=1 Tax=Cavenderia fasciculata TaxID=261658 RepID=F4QD57_CACFS|nr:uncharacterized protein DFA_12304 [Cavenderia fasciculata]EGG14528.1 hypothetical protein DFA_12304 [Cavenderia fasciculata]|eukprot:XP_004353959.1 hypothetical protein DFA_12304 [Cavenderia fasciculata]
MDNWIIIDSKTHIIKAELAIYTVLLDLCCLNPHIDVETFTQIELLASPKSIKPRNPKIMSLTKKSRKKDRIQYLIDRGYKDNNDQHTFSIDYRIIKSTTDIDREMDNINKELEDQVNTLKIKYNVIICERYNQPSIDHYIESNLKDMIYHYKNTNQNNNNEPYSWFTKQEIDMISKF